MPTLAELAGSPEAPAAQTAAPSLADLAGQPSATPSLASLASGKMQLQPSVEVPTSSGASFTPSDYQHSLVQESPIGLVGRGVGKFAGNLGQAVKSNLDLLQSTGSRWLNGTQPDMGMARQQALVNQENLPPQAPAPPLQAGGFQFSTQPTAAGTQVANATTGVPDEVLAQNEANRLAAMQEDQATGGASLLRDTAMSGLALASPVNPLAAAGMVGVPAAMETVGLNKKMKDIGDWGKVTTPQGQELNDTIAHTVRNTLAEALPQIMPLLLPAVLGHATKSLEIKPGESATPADIPAKAEALDQQAIQKSIERNTAKEAGIKRQGLLPSEPAPEPQAPLLQRIQQPSETSLASLASKAPGVRTLLKPFKSDLPTRQATLAEAAQNIPQVPTEETPPPPVAPAEAQAAAEKITGALREYPSNEQLARSLADTSFERIAGQGPNSYDLAPAEQMRLRQLLAGLPKTPNMEGKLSVSDTPGIQDRQARYYQQALQAFDSATPADIANPKLRQAYAAESAMNRVAEDVNPAFNPKNAFNYAHTRAEKAVT